MSLRRVFVAFEKMEKCVFELKTGFGIIPNKS
jgi:hypothetical protein